jgi:hypothetical protein
MPAERVRDDAELQQGADGAAPREFSGAVVGTGRVVATVEDLHDCSLTNGQIVTFASRRAPKCTKCMLPRTPHLPLLVLLQETRRSGDAIAPDLLISCSRS